MLPRSISPWPLRFGSALLFGGLLANPLGGAEHRAHFDSSALKEQLKGQPVPEYFARGPAGIQLWKLIQEVYRLRQYSPLWTNSLVGDRRARELGAAISQTGCHGLAPSLYQLHNGAHWLDRAQLAGEFPPGERAEAEVVFTHAFLRLSQHLFAGQLDPRWARWELKPRQLDWWSLLQRLEALGPASVLNELAPRQPGYRLLQQALKQLRKRAEQGKTDPIPEGQPLYQGVRGKAVLLLRQQLISWGDLDERWVSGLRFDAPLAEAVKRFQARHGLETDGMVGPKTRQAVNRTPEDRIRQIELNLERWRWLPRNLGSTHLIVNVAEARLRAFVQNQEMINMAVVVGSPDLPTRLFSDELERITFWPFWNVPASLAATQILPNARRDPDYLVRKHFEVLTGDGEGWRKILSTSIDWSSISPLNLPYQFRQRPGPWNSLGSVVFEFPNRFNIYLHDTPEQELFSKAVRTASNGCIRVQHPRELARFLVGQNNEWSLWQIDDFLRQGATRELAVEPPIPIHLVYFTAWVEADGKLHFREDVYGHDRRLNQLLTERPDGVS